MSRVFCVSIVRWLRSLLQRLRRRISRGVVDDDNPYNYPLF